MILARAAAKVPAWTVADHITYDDWAYQEECTGTWSDRSISGSSGGVSGFQSEAQASDAADTLAENLTSCTKTAWRTRPIAQTGAILATSRGAVARIVQKDTFVRVYQVPTTDGPPPVDVRSCRRSQWVSATLPYSTFRREVVVGHGDYERLTPQAIDQVWLRMRAGQAAKPTARELGLFPGTVRGLSGALRWDQTRAAPKSTRSVAARGARGDLAWSGG